MKWQPTVIGGLFLDEADYNGILFYYYDIIEEHKKIEAEIKRAKTKTKR